MPTPSFQLKSTFNDWNPFTSMFCSKKKRYDLIAIRKPLSMIKDGPNDKRLIHILVAFLPALILLNMALAPKAAVSAPLKTKIRTLLTNRQPYWVGQGIRLNIELWSSGTTFAEQQIKLPDIPNVVISQPTYSPTLFDKENDEGSWKVQTCTIQFFPQVPGKMTIPPLSVTFKTTNAEGDVTKTFSFSSTQLEFTINMPKEVPPGAPLITTTALMVKQKWHPEPLTLKKGEALTRTIAMQAKNLPPSLLPHPPIPSIAGITVYREKPQIRRTDQRGEAQTECIEALTYVFQQTGHFALPGFTLYWWNPDTNHLKQIHLDGLNVIIQEPALSVIETADSKTQVMPSTWSSIPLYIPLVILILLLIFLILWLRPLLYRTAGDNKQESVIFHTLSAACRRNDIQQALLSLQQWQSCTNLEGVTLKLLLQERCLTDFVLAKELERLQDAHGTGHTSWNGVQLHVRLTAFREEELILKQKQRYRMNLS